MKVINQEYIDRLLEEHDCHEGRNRLIHYQGQRLIAIDIFSGRYIDGTDFTLFECKDLWLNEDKFSTSPYQDQQSIEPIMLDMYYDKPASEAQYFTTQQEAKNWIHQNIDLY